MVFETVTLSIIALLLFILLLSRKTGTLKSLLGILTAAASVIALVFFLRMQRSSGNPAAGPLLYLPCALYLIIAVWGLLTSIGFYRKKKRDREARRALKDAKKQSSDAE